MNHRSSEKHFIGEAFSIQQLRKLGFDKMARPHSHTCYELYYLLHGERVYFMNGNVYVARKGDLMLVMPGDLHSTSSSQVEEFERVLLHFSPEFLSGEDGSILEQAPFLESGMIHLPLKEQPELERLLLTMLAECQEHHNFYETFVRQLLTEFLIRVHRTALGADDMPQPRHPMHQKISEISAYIHEHYREPLTLEELSRQFYISPAYLSRVFLKLTGFHLSEYIRVVRVREAQNMLRNTREKIQLIAEQVGFEHVSHFNKTFKSITGSSPLHYRKQHRM